MYNVQYTMYNCTFSHDNHHHNKIMIMVDPMCSAAYNVQDNKINQRSHLDLSATVLKERRL